jgi:molecular chaperone DnaJ
MATAERDYYTVLGVGRDSSDAEIKRAFRALARKLHPDVGPGADPERFREVAEAYEVLSNPETRRLYDRFGHAGLQRRGFSPSFTDFGTLADVFAAFFGDDLFGAGARTTATRGGDVQAAVRIELVEAFAGVEVSVPFDVAARCERCQGTGAEPGTGRETCPTCSGRGVLEQVSRTVLGEFVRRQACGRCQGTGEVLIEPCEACGGDGRTMVRREVPVDVPAGIQDGMRIRLQGQGHAGALDGEPGDAYIVVRVLPDPRFVRDGDDLHTAVLLTMIEASLGAIVSVPSPEGDVELEVEPGTQPAEVRVLRGKGMPSLQGGRRGNLQVRLDVAVPTRLTDEQQNELRRFAQGLADDAYAAPDREGFFRRLRGAIR